MHGRLYGQIYVEAVVAVRRVDGGSTTAPMAVLTLPAHTAALTCTTYAFIRLICTMYGLFRALSSPFSVHRCTQ